MDNFSKLLSEALESGETIESAFREAVAKAAQEAIDGFMDSEMTAYLGGYERYDRKNGDNSGDSRNGRAATAIVTSTGSITVSVPRDHRDGGFHMIEEALEKRLVAMFLHYKNGVDARKARDWMAIVGFMGK